MVRHQWKQSSVAKGERNRDCESTHSTYARGQWLQYAIAMTATTSTNAARGERSEDDQKMNTRKFTRKGSDSRPEASGGTRALETKAWNPRPEASRTQSVPKAGSRNTQRTPTHPHQSRIILREVARVNEWVIADLKTPSELYVADAERNLLFQVTYRNPRMRTLPV